MIPVIQSNIEIKRNMPEAIKLGNLGTAPLLKYSIKTGTKRHIENIRNITANILKNNAGLYSLNNLAIVLNTLTPSPTVLSLDGLSASLS